MSRPLKGCFQLIKRAVRYLVERPRGAQLFEFERGAFRLIGYSDSDWAGCQLTRKSTSGGVIMLGSSVLKSWSSVQTTVATSSGKAELYAMIRAASQFKHIMSIGADFDMGVSGLVRTDSTAALHSTEIRPWRSHGTYTGAIPVASAVHTREEFRSRKGEL